LAVDQKKFRDSSTPLGMTEALFLYRLGFRRALLRINHDTLERVDRAQHLWIFRLDNLRLVVRPDISSVAQSVESTLLFGGHADANIWRHAVTLNDLSAGRVVLGRGKTHRGSVRQLQHILHGPFSKSSFTNKDRPTQILKRTCHDLRAARAAFVDKQHHRKIRTWLTYGG